MYAKSLLLIKCDPQKQTRTEENISMKDKSSVDSETSRVV